MEMLIIFTKIKYKYIRYFRMQMQEMVPSQLSDQLARVYGNII